jgi:MmyB-like transcription regulator ligand binding domain
VRWAAHNVRFHHTGIKRIHHPEVGELEFVYEPLSFPDNPEWLLFALVPAESGRPSNLIRSSVGSLAASAESTAPDLDRSMESEH